MNAKPKQNEAVTALGVAHGSDGDARIYPCDKCGLMRSKAEGGTTFTVCDDCWDKLHAKITSTIDQQTPPIVSAAITANLFNLL